MSMKKIVAAAFFILILSCTDKNNTTSSTNKYADTATAVYQTDSNVPIDTNDHNIGNVSTETLDSSTGPPKNKHH